MGALKHLLVQLEDSLGPGLTDYETEIMIAICGVLLMTTIIGK